MKKLTAFLTSIAMLGTAVSLLPTAAEGEQTSEEQLYASVLERVYTRLSEGFDHYDDENDILYGAFSDNPEGLSYLWYYDASAKTLDNCGFLMQDVNGDGTQELIIGTIGEDGTRNSLYDLYTIYNGEVIHLCASGERDWFDLTDSGEICESGSGGAALHTVAYYGIEGGLLSVNDAYEMDGDTYKHATSGKFETLTYDGYSYTTYVYDWEESTAAEFEAGESSRTIADYTYTPFSSYVPGTGAAQDPETVTDTPAGNGDELYKDVLDRFCTRLTEGFGNYADDNTTYGVIYDNNPAFSYLWYSHADLFTTENVGFTFLDLNGDGTDELIIGNISDTGEGSSAISELYTIRDGEVYHLAASGERDYFNLTEGNLIRENGSGSAFESVTYFYTVDAPLLSPAVFYKQNTDGTFKTEQVTLQTYTDSAVETRYYEGENWETITSETYESEIASRTEVNLFLMPFSEYTGDFSGGEPSLGDWDSDGLINASDATEVLIAAARFGAGDRDFLNDSQRFAGDTNSDGLINAEDATNILLYSAYFGSGGRASFLEFLEPTA